MEANKQYRPKVSREVAAFFAPEAPAAVPAWLADSLRRSEATEAALRCPSGAQVYATEDAIGCAIPRGGGIPVRHGLQLSFWASGLLNSQRLYDRGLLRWWIDYHPSGGRSSVGFYADVEPGTHLEHGLQTSFAPSGHVVSQGWFWNGKRHGWSKLWEDDGFPIRATLFDDGREVGTVLPDGTRQKA